MAPEEDHHCVISATLHLPIGGNSLDAMELRGGRQLINVSPSTSESTWLGERKRDRNVWHHVMSMARLH